MHAHRRHLLLFAAAAVLLISGCSDDETELQPVDQAEVNQQLHVQLGDHLTGAADAALFLDSSVMMDDALGLVAPVTMTCSSSPDPDGEPICEETRPETSLDMREDAQALTSWLQDVVFTEANIESTSETSVTYRLPDSVLCDATSVSDDEPIGGDCESPFGEHPVRLVVTSPRDGQLDVALRIGDVSRAPFTLELSAQTLALTLDLAGLEATLDALIPPDVEAPPVSMSGRLRLALTRVSDGHHTLTLGVTEAIALSFGQGEAQIEMQVAAAPQALVVDLDAAARRLTTSLDLGAVDLRVPGDLLGSAEADPSLPPDDGISLLGSDASLALHLGGASGSLTLTSDEQESLTIDDIGLGDTSSTLSVNDVDVFTLDLNPDAGRRLSATLRAEGDDLLAELSPGLDLLIGIHLAQVADTLNLDALPVWMQDETLRVLLDGAEPAIVRLGEQTEVVAGTLTLRATSLDADVVVSAGQCLVNTPIADPQPDAAEPHPFASFNASACSSP